MRRDLNVGADPVVDGAATAAAAAAQAAAIAAAATDATTKANAAQSAAIAAGLSARYISAQRTGTGSEETIPHSLGILPTDVLVCIEYLPALADVVTMPTTLSSQGTHTTTNILVTVLNGAKYRIRAQP